MSSNTGTPKSIFVNSWTKSQRVVETLFQKVIGEMGLDLELTTEVPADRSMGDVAVPCFKLSKALRKAPPVLAKELAAQIEAQVLRLSPAERACITKVQAVGPYINFFLDSASAFQSEASRILDGTFFMPDASADQKPKTMIEFSQPNTHKAFHVGHCRNVALGDALVRMNRYVGFEVVAANYPGDDGAHVAKCLWYFKKQGADHKMEAQEKSPGVDLGEWVGEFYTLATQALEDAQTQGPEAKKEIQAEISKVQQLLEARSPEWHALWLKTRQWSLDSFAGIYDWLGVKFDHYFFESEMLEESRKIVQEYLANGVFVRSEGAIGVDLEADKLPFFLLLKTDGTTLYSARDLALARRKFEDFQIRRSIYVVASEQDLHFRQVFKTLERMGFAQAHDCFHLSYGLVTLPSGKMSSRQGNVILFSQLKDLLLTEISKLLEGQTEVGEQSTETARRIAIAAIKYGMIASDPKKQIVFDLPKWVAFTGDTGPYLLYTSVRIRSILRKVATLPTTINTALDASVFQGENERPLVLKILEFNSVVERGVRENSPAILATALFEICQEFNTFYGKVSIMQQTDPARLAAYVMLLRALDRVIATGCDLLGIEMVERM